MQYFEGHITLMTVYGNFLSEQLTRTSQCLFLGVLFAGDDVTPDCDNSPQYVSLKPSLRSPVSTKSIVNSLPLLTNERPVIDVTDQSEANIVTQWLDPQNCLLVMSWELC